MIFYALDLYYDKNPSEELVQFLSEMSPFTFKQIGSADPAVFIEFCRFIGDDIITMANSYEKAKEYVASITEFDIATLFQTVDEEKWKRGCEQYLKNDHKGSES